MDTEVTLTVRVDGPGGALVPERTLEFQLTTGVRGLPDGIGYGAWKRVHSARVRVEFFAVRTPLDETF